MFFCFFSCISGFDSKKQGKTMGTNSMVSSKIALKNLFPRSKLSEKLIHGLQNVYSSTLNGQN